MSDKKQWEELPSCLWCRWRSSGKYLDKDRATYVCFNPSHNPRAALYSVSVFNNEGECEQYAPSGFTKLVRLIGARKPMGGFADDGNA